MGKGDKSNPMESFRKKEKKREAQRNKENKFKARAESLAKQGDTSSIESQIRSIEYQQKGGTADKKMIAKKKQLMDAKQIMEQKKAEYEATDLAQIENYRKSMTQEATKSVAQLEAETAAMFPNPEDSIYYHPVLNPFGAPPPGAKPIFRSQFNAGYQIEGGRNPVQGLLTGPDAPNTPSIPILNPHIESTKKDEEDEIDRELDLSKVPLPPGPPPRFLKQIIPPLPLGPPPAFVPPPHMRGPPMMSRTMVPPVPMPAPPVPHLHSGFPPGFQPGPPPHLPQLGIPPPPGMSFPPGISAPPAPPLKRQRAAPSEPTIEPSQSSLHTQPIVTEVNNASQANEEEQEDMGPMAGPSRPPTMEYSSVIDVYPPPPPDSYSDNGGHEEPVEQEIEEQDDGIAMMVPMALRVQRREQPKSSRQRPVASFPAKPKEKDEAFDEFMEDMKELGAV